MKKAAAILALGVVACLLLAPALEAQTQYGCFRCHQICWGWLLGCEWFCFSAPYGGGYERCYAETDGCQQFEVCYYYVA